MSLHHFSRGARMGCAVCFYWFAFRASLEALAISEGWHKHPPEGLAAAEPLTMFVDGAIAVLMWWLHRRIWEE